VCAHAACIQCFPWGKCRNDGLEKGKEWTDLYRDSACVQWQHVSMPGPHGAHAVISSNVTLLPVLLCPHTHVDLSPPPPPPNTLLQVCGGKRWRWGGQGELPTRSLSLRGLSVSPLGTRSVRSTQVTWQPDRDGWEKRTPRCLLLWLLLR
jgi:hypothetical protein